MENREQFTLMYLNTWGGRVKEPLNQFFQNYSDKVEVSYLETQDISKF